MTEKRGTGIGELFYSILWRRGARPPMKLVRIWTGALAGVVRQEFWPGVCSVKASWADLPGELSPFIYHDRRAGWLLATDREKCGGTTAIWDDQIFTGDRHDEIGHTQSVWERARFLVRRFLSFGQERHWGGELRFAAD